MPSEEVQRILAVVVNNASRVCGWWMQVAGAGVGGSIGCVGQHGSVFASGAVQPGGLANAGHFAAQWAGGIHRADSTTIASARDGSKWAMRCAVNRPNGSGLKRSNRPHRFRGAADLVGERIVGPWYPGRRVQRADAAALGAGVGVRRQRRDSNGGVAGIGWVCVAHHGTCTPTTARRRMPRSTRMDASAAASPEISGLDRRDRNGALQPTTLSTTLERLKRYNAHLEQLAGGCRTSCEPFGRRSFVARQSQTDGGGGPRRLYLARADEGIRRLAALIARLSRIDSWNRCSNTRTKM